MKPVRTTRLLVPQDFLSLVRVLARGAGVQDWTDLGSADGTTVSSAISGLPLSSKTAVLLCPDAPPKLSGWEIRNSDVRKWADSLNGRCGDCVSMFDVIEHFNRSEADALLDILERSFRVVVAFTPRGLLQQDGSTHPELRDDPLMWHRCGFTEDDFAARGYLTFFWPRFHFLSSQPPHGAVLAVRVRDANSSYIEMLRQLAIREHRRMLFKSPALRKFLIRTALWTAAGNKGLQLLSRLRFEPS
jgi:hypothetical protein